MTRADVNIYVTPAAYQSAGHQLNPVEVASGNQYIFFIYLGDNQLYYVKSSDGGISYGDPVLIKTGALAQLAIWYDRWTPGDSGNLIHLAYTETGADDIFYRNLDTSSDTLSTEQTIFAGLSAISNNAGICLALTKARGGNLYCLFDIDAGSETGFYRSTDGGMSWGSRSNTAEGSDYFILMPGFTADSQDVICVFWDRSASEISRKLYDDSADSWSEASIAGSMTSVNSTTCVPQMAAMVDATNSKIIVIAWTNRDTAGARLRCWSIDESAINALTDVVSSSTDDQQMCTISRNTANDDWYAFYGGKTDGTETAGTSINIYYKVSTDDGTSWGSETLLTLSPRNYSLLFAPLTFATDFWVMFRAISAANLNSIINSVLLPSVAVPGGSHILGGGIIR
jgi:hypothetical protein